MFLLNRKEKREKKKELNVLNDVITVINQYFPELISKFEGLTDLRHQSYVTYKMKVIFIVRLFALMCEIKSMQGITREFNTEEAIENIATICGLTLDEIPHCDTINDVFKNIDVSEIEEIRKYMIVKMIRNKMLEKYLVETQQSFDLWRTSIHDYKHNIFYLSQLADEGNIQEIRNYQKMELSLKNI